MVIIFLTCLLLVLPVTSNKFTCSMCQKIVPYVAPHECASKCSHFWKWTQSSCDAVCVDLAAFSPATACYETGYCNQPLELLTTAPAPGPLATPNPIYDASKYATKLASTTNGVLYQITAPDTAPLKIMHVYGNAYERGVAHGQLLSDDLVQFMTTDLQSFFLQECNQIPVDKLPKWLANAVTKLCKDAAPTAFTLALGWVWEQQKEYVNASKTHVLDEMAGIADGICTPVGPNATVPSICSNKKKLLETVYHVNMLPELVQMQCSMMGAWGAATPNGKLTQLRTLDFGGGPFADRSMLVVHHPTDTSIPFAALSFPAFTGIVTGFSKNLAQSEKVDDVSGGNRPKGQNRLLWPFRCCCSKQDEAVGLMCFLLPFFLSPFFFFIFFCCRILRRSSGSHGHS